MTEKEMPEIKEVGNEEVVNETEIAVENKIANENINNTNISGNGEEFQTEEVTVKAENVTPAIIIDDEPKADVHKKVKKKLIVMPKRKEQTVTDDAKSTKKIAWLAYILFFIPLLINKKSNFVRLHANEGLEINLVDLLGIVLIILGAVIKTTSLVWHAILILSVIIGIGLLILTTISKVYMIIASLKGLSYQTPWFCKVRFIKDYKE